MSYINMSYASTVKADLYIQDNWIHSSKVWEKHVVTRGANILLIPASFITRILDTMAGLVVGIGAICTLGTHKATLRIAHNHLASTEALLVRPYKHLLQAINPGVFLQNKSSKIIRKGVGFITGNTINVIREMFESCGPDSSSFLNQHIISRLKYVLLATACLITRAVDGIIAIPAACLSILTGGRFQSLNNLAFRALQAPAIILDLFMCTIGIINPQAVDELRSG